MEEEILIQSLKEGSQEAFRALVATHGDRVYNTVLSMMQSAEDAEDVVQETFSAVYQNIRKFRGDAKLSTWIYRIAVTKALEALRKNKRNALSSPGRMSGGEAGNPVPVAPRTPFHHPGVATENRERAAILYAALNKLPDNQKTAFLLHKSEGLSYAEIAGVMKTTLPAVESLIYRGRQSLQKLLAHYYNTQKG